MKTKALSREARFMPGGIPRYVRCYDSSEADDPSFDTFTVLYTGRAATTTDAYGNRAYEYVCLSGHGSVPFRPADTYNPATKKHCFPPAMGRKCHLGRRVPFSAIPYGLQQTVLRDYREIWQIPA